MHINFLVGAITAIVLVFVAIWLMLPKWRLSIEAPKFAVAHWDEERAVIPSSRTSDTNH